MRLCSDNALATATRGRHSTPRHTPRVASPSCCCCCCCKLQAATCTTFKGSLAARTEASKNMRYSLSAGMHLCTSSDSSFSSSSNSSHGLHPSAAPSAAAAAAFAFKHFHLPLKRSCCRFIVFVFLLVALHCPAAPFISLSLSPTPILLLCS